MRRLLLYILVFVYADQSTGQIYTASEPLSAVNDRNYMQRNKIRQTESKTYQNDKLQSSSICYYDSLGRRNFYINSDSLGIEFYNGEFVYDYLNQVIKFIGCYKKKDYYYENHYYKYACDKILVDSSDVWGVTYFEYDALSRNTSEKYISKDGLRGRTLQKEYSNASTQISKLTERFLEENKDKLYSVTEYKYGPDNKLIAEEEYLQPGDDGGYSPPQFITYKYDDRGLMIEKKQGDAILQKYNYNDKGLPVEWIVTFSSNQNFKSVQTISYLFFE